MPQRDPHTGRNIFIVIGAVLIIAGGFFALKYWSALTNPVTVTLPGSEHAPAPVPEPVTPAERAQVLEKFSAQVQATSTATPAARANILQSARSSSTASAPPSSAAANMNILQSAKQ